LVLAQNESSSFGLYDITLMRMNSVGDVIWMKSIGGVQNDLCYNLRKSIDSEYFLYGITYSYGKGAHDFIVLKISESGNLTYAKTIGTTAQDYSYAVNQTQNGDIYIAGYTYSSGKDNILMKTTSDMNNIVWQKDFSYNKDEYVCDILPTAEDGIFVNGITYSYGAGDMDIFLANFTTDGQMNFFKTYGGVNKDQVANKSSFLDKFKKIVIGAGTQSYNHKALRAVEFDGYLIKTDYSGNSGCNEKSHNLTVKNSNLILGDITSEIGVKSVNLTVMNAGTSSATDFQLTSLCFTGINNDTRNFDIRYNNPINNNLNIVFSEVKNNIVEITVTDALGKIMYTKSFTRGYSGELNIETENWLSGFYFVTIKADLYSESIKIVKVE